MLRENNLYISGRIICFKDDLKSRNSPPLALKEAATPLLYSDSSGSAWLNVYEQGARDYIKDLVTACIELGFDEIILDHFYLPNVTNVSNPAEGSDISREDAVRGFVMEIRSLINELTSNDNENGNGNANGNGNKNKNVKLGLYFPLGTFLNTPNTTMGLDPNGLINVSDFFTTSFVLADIPSNAINVSNPESSPYEAIKAVSAVFSDISERTVLRPDLQAFDSESGIVYDDDRIRNQRQALQSAGISGWTLINYENNY
jgi:hypothetical protein